jgi:hypothetical protein
MIIAMAVMGVMQPPVHQVVDVITVGHCLVSAVWAMRVRAHPVRRAARGIGVVDLDNVLVDVILVHVVQMAVVEVVDMAIVAHSSVPAARTMLMSVTGMMLLVTGNHGLARLLGGHDPSNFTIPLVNYALPIWPSARIVT